MAYAQQMMQPYPNMGVGPVSVTGIPGSYYSNYPNRQQTNKSTVPPNNISNNQKAPNFNENMIEKFFESASHCTQYPDLDKYLNPPSCFEVRWRCPSAPFPIFWGPEKDSIKQIYERSNTIFIQNQNEQMSLMSAGMPNRNSMNSNINNNINNNMANRINMNGNMSNRNNMNGNMNNRNNMNSMNSMNMMRNMNNMSGMNNMNGISNMNNMTNMNGMNTRTMNPMNHMNPGNPMNPSSYQKLNEPRSTTISPSNHPQGYMNQMPNSQNQQIPVNNNMYMQRQPSPEMINNKVMSNNYNNYNQGNHHSMNSNRYDNKNNIRNKKNHRNAGSSQWNYP